MTKVITRYFDSADQANAALQVLLDERFPSSILQVHADAEGLVDRLTSAHVDQATAEAYKARMATGGAVLLVNANYTPLCAAQTTREVTARMGAVDMGDLVQEVFVKDAPTQMSSVLKTHPLMLTRRRDPNKTNHYMADWPIPLISRRKPFDDSAFPRHARMANWPIPLIADLKPRDSFAFPRHARMANFILPLTIRTEPRTGSVFPRHARMANWPIPLLSRRKPWTGSLIARHARMANWPFPHLINGKTGTNSLMPGGPRMADKPMNLISDRKPYTGSIFPRHARMAKMILPLLSSRKPFTGSIFPRHARMANFILPLVVRKSDRTEEDGRASVRRSGMFGLPTVVGR